MSTLDKREKIYDTQGKLFSGKALEKFSFVTHVIQSKWEVSIMSSDTHSKSNVQTNRNLTVLCMNINTLSKNES